MFAFRALLATTSVAVVSYTAIIVMHHGTNLFSTFVGDIPLMRSPGQLNGDVPSLDPGRTREDSIREHAKREQSVDA